MFHTLKPKISVSEELLSTNAYDKRIITNNLSKSFHSPSEIFRNNTTAVEVIVKEIRHKGKRQIITNIDKVDHSETATVKRLNGEIDKLKRELHEAHSNLEETQRCFKLILDEMKNKLDEANQRELQTQTKNVVLQLEKEKFRTLLDSKTNLIAKLKKEFTAMKKMLKIVIKGIRGIPPCPYSGYYSDEYDKFEKDLRNSAFTAVADDNSINHECGLKRSKTSK